MPSVPNTSVDQIFDALHLLAERSEPLGVAEVAKELEIPTSTAHRLLATIDDAGFAARDSTGNKYELGVRSHALVHGFFRQFKIQPAAGPYLARTAAELGETTTLDVRVGWHVVRMVGFEGWREVHAGTRIGQTLPLAESAGGLVVLAHLPEDEVLRYLRWEGGGRRSGARTRALTAQLDATRSRGYAREEGSNRDGSEIAFAIRSEGRAFAALCIDGIGPIVGESPPAGELDRADRIVKALEQAVIDDPDLAIDRFSHLDPDQMAQLMA